MKHRNVILTAMLFSAIAIIFSISFIYIRPNPIHAQTTDWQATFLFRGESGMFLQNVNANGVIDTIPVSDAILGEGQSETSIFVTSPDSRYILHKYYAESDGSPHVRFGATGDGPCCTDVSDLVSGAIEFRLGGFEPNGSRFALSYVTINEGGDQYHVGGIVVIDAAQATLVAELTMQAAVADNGIGEIPNWASLGRWTADGIHFIGDCFACGGGYLEGMYSVWNPDTDTISADSGIAMSEFGAALEGTGEFVRRGQDTRFFYDPSPGVYEIPNVLHYFTSSNLAETPIPIYDEADTLTVGQLSWVGDGQAVLVAGTTDRFWDVVFRDGRIERIQETPPPTFMGGTPAGWFAAIGETGNRSIAHYSIETLQPTVVAPFPDGVTSAQVTYLPPMGLGFSGAPFAAITPPDVAQAARCPDSLPARLIVGQSATVLAGSPNRIRQYPGVDAPIVGDIPSGATFSVLSGPTCDGTTVTWWYVDYEGITGWTAEGQDDTYFVEPAE